MPTLEDEAEEFVSSRIIFIMLQLPPPRDNALQILKYTMLARFEPVQTPEERVPPLPAKLKVRH